MPDDVTGAVTPGEWADKCEPWADALMADESDRNAALACADWFDENVPEYLAGNAYQFRADAAIRCPANSHTLLDMLGNRAACPFCRPPLRDRDCWLCGNRRHVRKRATPGVAWQIPIVARAAVATDEQRVWQNWRVGVCGHPAMTCDGWGPPVKFKEEVAIDLGRAHEYESSVDLRTGRVTALLWADHLFDPLTHLAAFRATLRGHFRNLAGDSIWAGGGDRLDALAVTAVFVTDAAGRLAGRHGSYGNVLRPGCGTVGFQLDTDSGG